MEKTNSLAFNIDGKNLSIRFDCSFEFDELALEVEAITPQKSESVLISIQQGLDLEIADAVDDDDKFVGSRRRYFTQKTLDLGLD